MSDRRSRSLDSYPEVLSVEEVAAFLGLSRNATYAAVARGEIRSVRVGRRVLIARQAVIDLLGAR